MRSWICSSKWFIHRDLKLENILLSFGDDGSGLKIKLADWGLACRWNTSSTISEHAGSLYYAAPEIIAGKPYVGPEIDCWSIGVVLYALCTLQLPFFDEGGNNSLISNRILRANYQIPATVDPPCASLISSILQVDPLHRASLEAITAHKWLRSSATENASAVVVRTPRRHKSFDGPLTQLEQQQQQQHDHCRRRRRRRRYSCSAIPLSENI